jgi:hypothetical protein
VKSVTGSAGFQPASFPNEERQNAGKMPALPVLVLRNFALLHGQSVFTRANPAFTGFSSMYATACA